MKRAVFPGSFDPITIGHKYIAEKALEIFDEIIIAIGYNSQKKGFFPIDKRLEWIKQTFKNNNRIKVDLYEGLTIDFCKKNNADFIIRGLRTSADFEYERMIAQNNKLIDEKIETIFILTKPELTAINSTIIRDIYQHKGDTSKFIPKGIVLKK